MKKILGTLLAVLFSFMAINDSAAQNTVLRFNKDGKFKIVQFTDVHFKYGNPASDVALERIGEVLDAEHPDLVIFTGDVVYSSPADKGMLQVLGQVEHRHLPFVVTFGNHDNEQGKTRAFDSWSSRKSVARPWYFSFAGLYTDSEILCRRFKGCCTALLYGFTLLLFA